jgi:hypothetical protein
VEEVVVSSRRRDGAVRSARSNEAKERSNEAKEECVQCGPRSKGFMVKGDGTQKSGRHQEHEVPLCLLVADAPELLRGESMTLNVT